MGGVCRGDTGLGVGNRCVCMGGGVVRCGVGRWWEGVSNCIFVVI